MSTRVRSMACLAALALAPCAIASCSTLLGIGDVGPEDVSADGSTGDAAGAGGMSADAPHETDGAGNETGAAAGNAGAPHGGAAGTAGAHGGSAGNAGGPQGGSSGDSGVDTGCVEKQACMAPGGWGACVQTTLTSCVGQRSRTIVTCQDGGCVDSDETQACNVPADTKCGEDKCCGAGQNNYPGCNGQCGSEFLKMRCDTSGNCKPLCEHVVCWGSGCGAGGVTSISCP